MAAASRQAYSSTSRATAQEHHSERRPSSTSGNPGINIANNTSGTIALSNASKVVTSGANPAVMLTNNTGATINFTGGGLHQHHWRHWRTTGGGTVNVTGGGNTITTTTGTALNVANTNIGASGLTFQSISANGAANGIVLNSTGASGVDRYREFRRAVWWLSE